MYAPSRSLSRFFPSFTFPSPMASYNYSTSSSEISTPRSASPSSVTSRSSTTTISKRMSLSQRRTSGFNPMASVDTTAIEAAMKISSLDVLRGYSQDHYGVVNQYRETDYVPKNQAGGYQVIREPAWNKGGQEILSRLVNPTNTSPQVLPSVLTNEFPKTSLG
jgi:malate dehydrogenase (oxaloacetate-decarboxylating)(NADP+)